MTDRYILVNGEPVPEPDLKKWGKWFQDNPKDRIVKQETIGDLKISTVFLGLDHRWTNDSGPPILWETMVFGGEMDSEQMRCTGSRADAEAMHQRMIREVIKEPLIEAMKKVKEGDK